MHNRNIVSTLQSRRDDMFIVADATPTFFSPAKYQTRTGFKISTNPDTVLAPDAAFVCQAAIDEKGIPTGYWEGAPDLVVEVISPSDTYTEVEEKVDEWLNAGCAMVWVINPRRETVKVYRSTDDISVLRRGDILDGGDVIDGFQCQVEDLFV